LPILDGQVALVTGGSRGIGQAICRELAAAGAAVAVNYRETRDAAEAVVAEIAAAGGRAVALQADVTREAAVRGLVAATLESLSRLDILVCNAGLVRDRLAAAMSLDDWETVIATNLRGPFLCIREALPTMMASKSGSIVVLSSIAADHGSRGHCSYSAAKGGVNSLVRSLAVELAPKRIRINAVSPGVILTDMTKRIRNMAGEEVVSQIPLGRFGEPAEVARAVRFLASSEASYITGEILHVTGGLGL
jgi:3-oxoacyl-[acyl-carrier protein] reductase